MSFNPSNNGYVEGRLHSMCMVDNAAGGGKTVFLTLSVQDNFKSNAGAYVADGETVKGYASHLISFHAYVRRDSPFASVFENLQDPRDYSRTSCDRGAPIGIRYHLTVRDSGVPITNAQGEVYQRADGSTVNHSLLVANVDSVHFRESLAQREARRAAREAREDEAAERLEEKYAQLEAS